MIFVVGDKQASEPLNEITGSKIMIRWPSSRSFVVILDKAVVG